VSGEKYHRHLQKLQQVYIEGTMSRTQYFVWSDFKMEEKIL